MPHPECPSLPSAAILQLTNAAAVSHVSLRLHDCTCACMTAVAVLTLNSALQARRQCTLAIGGEGSGKSCRQVLDGEAAFRLLGMGFEAERKN